MARSEAPGPSGADQSLGDLVSLAIKDVTQLVRYEVDLAKSELRTDAKRLGVAAALIGVAAFFGFFILICLTLAWVYGLNALGMPGGMWGAYLMGALSFLLVAALLVFAGIGWLKRKHLTGLKQTRQAVSDSLSLLRRKDGKDEPKAAVDTREPQTAVLTGTGGRSPMTDKQVTGPNAAG